MNEDFKYANQYLHSDVKPFEVVRTISEKCIEIRAMDFYETEVSKMKRQASFVSGGFVGHFDNSVQDWCISSNPDAKSFKIRRNADGWWYGGGCRFRLAIEPNRFYDFNF